MRTKKAQKRQMPPDSIYKSKSLNRLIHQIMQHGKKSLAESIVYTALQKLSEDKKVALQMFDQAIKNVMPNMEVRSRRVGGANYQVPTPLRHERSESLAVRWIVDAAQGKKGKPMQEKLAEELKSANDGTGSAIKKRDDMHKMAEANRAFAHFKF